MLYSNSELKDDKQDNAATILANSPEYYSQQLAVSLKQKPNIVNFAIPDEIVQLIAQFAAGIASIYIDKPGKSIKYSKHCYIGKNDTDLHLTNNSFSIECWLKLKFSSAAVRQRQGDQTIVGSSNWSNNHCLHIVIRNMRPKMGFYYNGIDSKTALVKNKWYHLAFLYNKKEQSQSIWINGKLDTISKGKHRALEGNYELYISHYDNGRPLCGWLRELRIWNYALTEEDIVKRMNTFNMSQSEIDKINDNGKNIVLRKLFCVNKQMEWVQKVPDYHKKKDIDNIIQYA